MTFNKYTIPIIILFIGFGSLLPISSILSLNRAYAITIPQEQEVAKEFMEMINKSNAISSDPIANHLVKKIGQHFVTLLPPQPFKFSFYFVNEDVFNAFAGPGANIFIYRGLITALDSMDELAGIIGHEIAHADSRHVSESFDRAKILNMGSLAGMLAGILIGSQSDNPEAGMTIAKGSMALGTTAMLAFTRENETEADEKGILFLKSSCFNPNGLLNGLIKIRESDYRGVEAIPDYVKTHPGTGDRIAHAESILAGYTPEKPIPKCDLGIQFDMVKYRMIGLYSNLDSSFKSVQTLLEKDSENAALHYGLGLLYDRKQRTKEALTHLKKALSLKFYDPMILIELARIYISNGDAQKALDILKGLETDAVVGTMVRYHQANAYLELGKYSKAKNNYLTVLRKLPEYYPKAYYNLAKIMSMEKEKAISHYYLGIYYSKIENRNPAMVHLNKALEGLKDKPKIENAKKLLTRLKNQSTQALKK